jgi:hypothetical protein
MMKTGFCNCLRPGEGDSDIDGPCRYLASLQGHFGNGEISI